MDESYTLTDKITQEIDSYWDDLTAGFGGHDHFNSRALAERIMDALELED